MMLTVANGSGPKRYDLDTRLQDWVYSRDGRSLGDLLNEELSSITSSHIDLLLGPEVQKTVVKRLGLS